MKNVIVVLAILLPLSSMAGTWKVETKNDPLTDEARTTATLIVPSAGNGRNQGGVVRCVNRKFEVFVDFGDYLGTSLIKVRFRVDKNPMTEDRWLTSADGTAVFAGDEASLARQWMNGSAFIIEATDFRGVPHRVSFDWVDGKAAIEPVLKACGVASQGMETLVPGLREDIANHLERWGPKNISVSKRILAANNAYSGPIDTTIEPAFALAVQSAYDNWIEQCRAKKVSGIHCTTLQLLWSANAKPTMPLPVSVIFEMSSGELKKEAGPLKISD